jgi:hypothetical protein
MRLRAMGTVHHEQHIDVLNFVSIFGFSGFVTDRKKPAS